MKTVHVTIGGQSLELSLENKNNKTKGVYLNGERETAQVQCQCGKEHGMSLGQTVRCSYEGMPVNYSFERRKTGQYSEVYFVRAAVQTRSAPEDAPMQRKTLWKPSPTPEFTRRDLETELVLSYEPSGE